jgi:hypothetical protein
VRRQRAARQLAQPRTQVTEAQPLEELPAVALDARAVAEPAQRHSRARHATTHRAFPLVTLGVIYLTSVLVYTWVGRKYMFPNLFPDEMYYGKLSQNLALGNGLEWRGSGYGLPPLWPALLSLVWRFGSTPEAYGTAKLLGATLASLVVIPTWLLATVFVGPRRALVAAALSVAGAWMSVTAFIVTENFAYPVATASLAALVIALHKTSVRWLGVSLAFAGVAAAARTQMLSLFVIVVIALAIDVLRQPRAQWREHVGAWPRALWIGLVTAVAALLLVFILKPGATNYDVLAHHASIGKIAGTAGRHAAQSIVAFGIIPVVAVFALMLRGENWRDEKVGPLLATVAAACVVLYPLIGRFEVWATTGHPVERYTMYIAPLACVVLVLAPGRVTRTTLAAAGALVIAALFAAPETFNAIEQPALFGLQERLHRASGYLSDHLQLGVVLVSVPLVIAAVLGLAARRRTTAAFTALVGLTVALMVMQAWTYHDYEAGIERAVRPEIAPAQFDWVDARAGGPVAMLAIGKGEPFHQNVDLYTDFFNKKIEALYSTEPVGANECEIDFAGHGYFKFDGGVCPAWPRYLVMLERDVHMTLRNETLLGQTSHSGRLVKIPRGQPRMFGLVKPPCTPDGCDGQLQLGVYLDAPARVSVTFGVSQDVHRIQAGNHIRNLPAGQPNTINFNLPKGDRAVNIPVDWTSTDGPALESVMVKTEGRISRIF